MNKRKTKKDKGEMWEGKIAQIGPILVCLSVVLCLPLYAEEPKPIFSESFDSVEEINANGGQHKNLTLVDGRSGKGVLVQQGSWLSFPTANNFNFQKGTIDFWVKPNWNGDWRGNDADDRTGRKDLFFVENDSYDQIRVNDLCYWNVRRSYLGTWVAYSYGSPASHTDMYEPYATTKWKAGEWHRIRVFWDFTLGAGNNYLIMSYDDHFASLVKFDNDYIPDQATKWPFYIGSFGQYYAFQSDAVFDDLKIYDHSLLPVVPFPEGTFDPSIPQTVMDYKNSYKGDGFCSDFETCNDEPDCPRLGDAINPGETVVFYRKPAFELVFENTVPQASEIKSSLDFQAAKGEYADLFFNVYSRQNLNNARLDYTYFTGPAGTIPRGNLDLRVVKNWFQAGKYSINKDLLPNYIPELLLNNDQVSPESGTYTLNNLASFPQTDYAQTKIGQYTSKQFVLIAKVPENIPAGIYTAKIKLSTDGVPDKELKLNLEVLSFKLKDTGKIYSTYYYSQLDDVLGHQVSPAIMQKEMKDLKDHGFNSLFTGMEASESSFQQKVLYMVNAGLTNKIIDNFDGTDRGSNLKPYQAFEIQQGLDSYHYGWDEPQTDESIKEQITISKSIHLAGGKIATAIPKEWSDKLDDPNDAIYSSFPAGTYEPLDWANLGLSSGTIEYLQGIAAGSVTKNPGKTETYYWGSELEFPQHNRFMAGYYLWNTKMDGVWPYAYQHPYTDVYPYIYNDFRQFSGSNCPSRLMLTTYPSQEGPIPTMQWEAMAAGINDTKYLATWEYYKDQVEQSNQALAQDSENLISCVLNHYRDYTQQFDIPMSQYEADRKTVIGEIIKLYNYLTLAVLYGDVSGDGGISAYDASLAAQYAVGLITLTADQKTKADVTGDGNVSAYDASLIAQKAVGLISKFPMEG